MPCFIFPRSKPAQDGGVKVGGLGLALLSLPSAHPTDDLPFALERGEAGASAAGWGAA